jgi:hypothetical protein
MAPIPESLKVLRAGRIQRRGGAEVPCLGLRNGATLRPACCRVGLSDSLVQGPDRKFLA